MTTTSRAVCANRISMNRMMAERQRLDRRIHNQRIALRQNWETMEKRAGHNRAWVRSPLLMSMLRKGTKRLPWWRRLFR